ncbi:MAG: hypothetical protein M0R05_07645, partial [Bacilli bacterium]|nr:hypothetical protein [Bacilli bacterium]
TTFTGKINGEYLPVRYNHGAWMPEGDQVIADGLTRTELSQVTEWHTVTVVKEGSTFTCTVDGEYGALTYTVVSGMAEVPADSLVYSGIYVLNDEVIVSSYDVTALDTDIPGTLPGVFGEPINAEIVAPILTEYDEEDFVDEIDKITTEGNREEIKDPDDDNDDDGNVPRQYTKDIWLLAFGGIVIIGIIVIVTILKKRKNHRGEK